MRLLYLTPRVPHPSAKGDQLAAYHRTVHLSRRHDITLVSLYENRKELEYVDELRDLCESVELVRHRRGRGVANVALRGPFTRDPFQVVYYRSGALQRLVESLAAERAFDVVHGFMLRMAPYLKDVGAASVLDALDSMQLRMARNVQVERPPMLWLYQKELLRVRPYERAVAGDVDAVIVASEQDREAFQLGTIEVVPNGVDTDLFAPDPSLRGADIIVFSGTMSYGPNVRAAVWFADECLPLIQAQVPSATFVIAGTAPAREIRELAQRGGIVVTGFVASMAETLNTATVAIAPMRSGAGIQNKILEAMACGLPLVTTTLGLGGIAAVGGREVLVADEAATFADAVAALLGDPARARELGENARRRVLESYTWEGAADAVDRVYERVVTR